MTDLKSQSPVEIDTALAGLYYESQTLGAALNAAIDNLHHDANDKRIYRYGRGQSEWTLSTKEALQKVTEVAAGDAKYPWLVADAKKSLDKYEAAKAAVKANIEAQKAFNEEFDRRGGWTRAFLVNNGDGHVHSSMNCSSCNRGFYATSFQWMTDYSAKDEAEIVAAAGWRACTICYPSAPVGDEKNLPTKMFSKEDISKAEAKKEREAAKAAREAAKIAKAPTKSGEALTVVTERGVYASHMGRRAGQEYERGETFVTERSAMIWAVDHQSLHLTNYYKIPHLVATGALVTDAIKVIAQAIADKRGVEVGIVQAEIDKKAEKKAKKSGSW